MHEREQGQLNEIESRVKDLPLREPSQLLDERIASMLSNAAQPSQVNRPSRWAMTAQLAALIALIAAVGIVLVFQLSEPSPSHGPVVNADPLSADGPVATGGQGNRLGPSMINANNAITPVNMIWSRDLTEEELSAPSGALYRAVVREVVDQQTWHNPETGTTLQINVPRHELVVISLPTY